MGYNHQLLTKIICHSFLLVYSSTFSSLQSADVFPVVASLPPKISYFQRERSENPKYVCASQAKFLVELSDFTFCGSPRGLCMSQVWISKPVVSCIEVEAMLLSVLNHFIGTFLCHRNSFICLWVVSCHFGCPMLLFQGHVACRKFILTGPRL